MKIDDFKKPAVLRVAKRILKHKKYSGICPNCLGRQFAQISTGITNKKRGETVRKILKMEHKHGKCPVCDDIFDDFEKYAGKVKEKTKNIEFESFVVGTKLSFNLINKEEGLWEEIGIEYCEPVKSELNREFGKFLFKKLEKQVDELNPHVIIILNLRKNAIDITINPLFIFGKYKKLVRGIPQTKWDKYPETVEDIIAKPFIKATGSPEHAMHGLGREDIDARCLDWRPFVLEIKKPRKRKMNFKKIEQEIKKTKKVMVKDLRFSNKKEVIKIKELRPDKTYRILIEFSKPIKREDIEKVNKLVGIIKQKTPARVMHRRADKLRQRKVKSIKYKRIKNKTYELIIRGEAGLYVKELVTGDNGRTKPSVTDIMGKDATVKELDVIKIHLKE